MAFPRLEARRQLNSSEEDVVESGVVRSNNRIHDYINLSGSRKSALDLPHAS